MIRILPKRLDWIELRNMQRATFFYLSSAVFFIYPFLVKTAIIFEDTLSFSLEVIGVSHELVIPLPFSLNILYGGALCMFIGNITYVAFCPKIIKEYSDYNDYSSTGMTKEYLFSILKSEIDSDSDICQLKNDLQPIENPPETELKRFFTKAYLHSSELHKRIAIFVQILFYLGFAAGIVVSTQNIYISVAHIV